MPGRNYNSTNYRLGFNGQEKTDEISGTGNHNTAEYWEYDTRLGRRWNLDPIPQMEISDYACFANNPIVYTDPNGDEVGVSSNVSKEDKETLKKDLEKKSGLTLTETLNQETGVTTFGIDKSKGVARGEDGKKLGSKEARYLLKKAIRSKEIVTISSDAGVDGPGIVDPEFPSLMRLNFGAIRDLQDNVKGGLNSETVSPAMIFFHEIFHTKLISTPIYDPDPENSSIFAKSQADISVNKVRRQLGASYGSRQTYSTILIKSTSKYIEGKGWESFTAMDKQSLKDIKAKRYPTGKFYLEYLNTIPKP